MDARIVMELQGARPPNTPIEIVKIEHRTSTRLALVTLRLPINGAVQEKEVRLDLDNRWFIDSVGDATIDEYVRAADDLVGIVLMSLDAALQASGAKARPSDDGGDDGYGGPHGSNGNGKPGNGAH